MIDNIKTTITYILSVVILSFAFLSVGFLSNSTPASALDPGCYTELPSGETQPRDCATDEQNDAVAGGQCVIFGPTGATITTCPANSTASPSGGSSANPGSGSVDGSGNLVPVNFGGTEDPDFEPGKQCGAPAESAVITSINFGCKGHLLTEINPVVDIAFAIFRVLSSGVGIIVIASVVVAGIQYTVARGNPQAIEASMKRISSSFIALFVYIFMFAIANFLVPGGMFL